MENILNQVEELIDDLERDSQMTREETLKALYKIKENIEHHQLSSENDLSFGYDNDY